MSPEAQRIAIAEACGWKDVHSVVIRNVSFQGDDRHVGITSDRGWVPNYFTDLNAMHEAEKVLTREQRDNYASELYAMLPCDENHGPIDMDNPEAGDVMMPSMFQMAHATAAQRSEAFLRTLGLWTE